MKPFRRIALLTALAATVCASASDPLRIEAEPAFSGADDRVMAVTLENDGSNAKGVLRVLGNGTETSYPVDLPRGASKRLITLNDGVEYGSLRLVLDTDRGTAFETVLGGVIDHGLGGSAVMIGDEEGGLAFLREKDIEEGKTVTAADFYVRPEDSPGRAAAYAPYDAVVLAPGAQRLGDTTVEALKEYAIGGGTLVFLGGTHTEVLNDRRWNDVLPGTHWHSRTVHDPSALSAAGGVDAAAAFATVVPSTEASGASAGEEGDFHRDLGLGKVVVVGYSPLDPPLSHWSGRMQAFAPYIRETDSLHARQFVNYYLNAGLNGARNTMYGETGSPVAPSAANDPFSTKLPSAGTVFGLLAGYFVLVVPVSFLVLRKFKRGELAWVTAPLLSLGFAGALFRSAEGLYAAKLSSASQGVVVLQEGQPRAMFYGTSQMFFPHGGDYDLRLRDVDQLTAARREDAYGTSALAGFDPVDDGREITVPRLQADNLAFREMSFSQRIPDADWFRIKPLDAKRVRVENRSPYLFQGWLVAGDRQGKARMTLASGKSEIMELSPEHYEEKPGSVTDSHNFTVKDHRIAVTGQIVGFRPGPQIGDEIASQSGVNVIAFAQENMP